MSSTRPVRSGVLMDTIVAPSVITRTSTPWPLARVKSSMALPSGIVPNGARVRVMAARITAKSGRTAGGRSKPDEIRDLDRPLLVDAVPDRDPREARHRAGARVGQLHVFRRVGLPENQVAHAIVAAAMPFGQFWNR